MKKLNYVSKATYIITGIVIIIAAFAICVGLGLIGIGVEGINFNF